MSSETMSLEESHEKWMSKAIELAKKGLYTTHPNPRVGCVLIRDNQIVGEGFHIKTGDAHAEINALKSAKGDAKGTTAYVTLEPCSHQGKTGPCAQALINAEITTVVYGMQDPNPDVMGKGLSMLEAAGIKVIGPVLEDEVQLLNVGFIKRMTEGLPFIRLKLAMSLDGRTAMESGESKWITGSEARLDVQKLRAQSDAIVTGIGSVVADNPSMTVRIDNENKDVSAKAVRQPRRVIIDTALSIPPESKILYPTEQVSIFCLADQVGTENKTVLEKKGIDLIYTEAAEGGGVDLVEAMAYLADQGINEVLVETGAVLAGSFLQAGLVDELVVYMAPKLLGSQARPLFELPFDMMDQAIDLQLQSMEQIGKDVRFLFTPDYSYEELDGALDS